MDEREILISACGEDEEGNSNAVISVKMTDLNAETGEENIIDEMVLEHPIVNIFRSIKYTMIDMTFQNPTDFEFVNLFGRLQTYCDVNSLSPDFNVVQTIVVTISPKEHLGEYFLVGMHGAWSIQPSKIGAPNDTVRFIFDNEYFNTFEMDLQAIEEEGDEDDTDESWANESIG